MKSLLTLVTSAVLFSGTLGFAADSTTDKALKAYGESQAVKQEIQSLKAQGFVEAQEPEVIEVSGGCGFAGCDANLLVVQRHHTRGANTRTRSVLALAKVPAVGAVSIQLSSLQRKGTLELPWTSSSDSTQATLKSSLYEAMKADESSPYPQGRIKGDYSKVEVSDAASKVSCEERKAPGLIQIQQFRCTIETR